MSGLKQKAKTFPEMVKEKLAECSFVQTNGFDACESCETLCTLEKWVRLVDAEEEIDEIINANLEEHKRVLKAKDEEIAKLKEQNKREIIERCTYTERARLLEAKIGQIREHTKIIPKPIHYYTKPNDVTSADYVALFNDLDDWVKKLVGLLGQNSEKPQPKKEK